MRQQPLLTNDPEVEPMGALVVYYSWFGNTRLVAEEAARQLEADVLELTEIRARPRLLGFFSGGFQALFGLRSVLQPTALQPEDYEPILLGTPVWAGRSAPAVNAFLDTTDLSGKDVHLFITMGGGNPSRCIAGLIRQVQRQGGQVKSSLSLTGRLNGVVPLDEVQSEIDEWTTVITGS